MKQCQKGQALVETAIAFPLLLLFIMGIAQFALILDAYSVVNYAAFCACRSGIVHNADDTQMKMSASTACAPIAGGMAPALIRTTVSKELMARQGTIPLTYLKVTVTHYFKLQFPLTGRLFSFFLGGMGSQYIPVKATCVMRMENE